MESKGHSIDDCPLREKIEDNHDRSKDNERKIKELMSGDWYSNKELYKMIQSLTSQLTEFNGKFDKYNGLIEERKKDRKLLNQLNEKVNKIDTKGKTKKEITTNWREWIGWVIAILLALSKLGVF
jgi:chromosome segregation ATPase